MIVVRRKKRLRAVLKTALLAVMAFLFSHRPRGVRVLMYHAVEGSGFKYSVRPELFARQVKSLAGRVVPLSDVVAYARGEMDLPDGSVAVTIDDGYLDTYETVFPLVKTYRIPVTVFLTTDLTSMQALGNLPRPTADQIKEMHASGLVTFEAHGRTHANLVTLAKDADRFREETAGCARDIEALTGRRSLFYAYAAGHRSPEVTERLKEIGFSAAFSIGEGTVRPGDDLFSLRRVQIDGTMPYALTRLRTTGPIDAYRALVHYFRV